MTNRFVAFVNNSLSSVLSVLCMRSPANRETRRTRRSDDVKSLVRMYYDAVMREIYLTVVAQLLSSVPSIVFWLCFSRFKPTISKQLNRRLHRVRRNYRNHCITLAQLIPVLLHVLQRYVHYVVFIVLLTISHGYTTSRQ